MMQALRSLGMLAVTVGLALGSGSSADAGLIPWSYNALFGYGPAYPQYAYYGGYGYGYDAGPVTYSASYGGYTSSCCGQAVTYYGPAPAGCCGSCNSCGSCGSCGTCATGNCGSCSTCGTNYGGDCSTCGGAGCSNCAPSTSGSNLTPQPDNGPKPTLADPPRRPGETDQFNPAAGTGGRNPMGNPYGGQNTAPPPAGNYNPGAADPRYNNTNPGINDPRYNSGGNTGGGSIPNNGLNNNTGAGNYQQPTNLGGGGSIPGGTNNSILGPGPGPGAGGSSIPRGAAPAEPGGVGGNAPRFPAGDNPAGGSNLFNPPANNNNGGEIEGNPLYRGTDPAKDGQGSIPTSDGPIAHSYDAHRNRSVLVAPTHTLTVTRVVIRGAEPTSERIAKK